MRTNVTAEAAEAEQSLPKAAALWILKTLVLTLALLAGVVVAGMAIPVALTPGGDGPLSMGAALFVVNGLVAVVLSILAARARVRGWRLALLVFVALFGIQTAVMQLETLYYNDSIHLPLTVLAGICAQAALTALITATVAALLFRPRAEPLDEVPSHLIVRLVVLSLVYVALYWGAGFFIAWQSEVVRAYYDHAAHIRPLPTIAFQSFRGVLWAMIALYVVARLKGSLASRALVMIVLFAVLTAAQLLYPNPVVPWAVRQVHIVEIAVSEALYGVVATFILLAGTRRTTIRA
jgi:hypothetical protein